jgi:diguanylate cyclase (GGDEF)-like protein
MMFSSERFSVLHPTHDAVGRVPASLLAAGDVGYEWDLATDRIAWWGAVDSLFGGEVPLTGVTLAGLIEKDDVARRTEVLGEHYGSGVPYDFEFRLVRIDGTHRWVNDRGRAELSEAGRPVRLLGVLRAIDRHKAHERRLEQRAYFDPLTGHLNRGRMIECLNDRLKHAGRRRLNACYGAVAITKLDLVQEGFGHDAVDAVVLGLAQRLKTHLRDGDVIARINHDEFGILLADCLPTDLPHVAQKLIAKLKAEPVETARGTLPITVSIGGIALSKRALSGQEIMLKAQNALAQAKARGHDCFVEYKWKPTQQRAQRTVIEIGERVLKALRSDRAPLAFQPVVETATGKVAYYEALLRVLDDRGTPVAAAEFIPAVEQLGLARIIDRHVIERAISELTENPDVTLSVNISGLTVSDPLWLNHLVALLEPEPLVARRLIIEITETVAMTDVEESERFVRALRQLGCQVAIDDFGAGYTSFRHLKQLNVDIVKIDGSFVQNLSENRENQLFVRTLNDLANGFGLKTVAEFVETADEAALLGDIGIGFLQGYYYGRPELGRIWRNSAHPTQFDPPNSKAKRR